MTSATRFSTALREKARLTIERLNSASFDIDQEGLIEYFNLGFRNFGSLWQNILESRDYEWIAELVKVDRRDLFYLPVEHWIRIVYKYAYAFHATPRQRFKLLNTMVPLYSARVASLVNELENKSQDEAEALFEDNARKFEENKDYIISLWNKSGGEK